MSDDKVRARPTFKEGGLGISSDPKSHQRQQLQALKGTNKCGYFKEGRLITKPRKLETTPTSAMSGTTGDRGSGDRRSLPRRSLVMEIVISVVESREIQFHGMAGRKRTSSTKPKRITQTKLFAKLRRDPNRYRVGATTNLRSRMSGYKSKQNRNRDTSVFFATSTNPQKKENKALSILPINHRHNYQKRSNFPDGQSGALYLRDEKKKKRTQKGKRRKM